jgi:hypothetical protein
VPLVQRPHAPEQNIQFCSYSKWRPLSQRQRSPKNKYMETSATYLGKLAKFEDTPAADLVSSWRAVDVKAITGAFDTALSRCLILIKGLRFDFLQPWTPIPKRYESSVSHRLLSLGKHKPRGLLPGGTNLRRATRALLRPRG